MEKQIKIALVDDEKLIVNLLKQFIEADQRYRVNITAHNGADFLALLKEDNNEIDIAIIDLQMEVMNGIETIKHMKEGYPNVKIITLSSHYKTSFMGHMMKLGINAFLPKGISPQNLLEVIQSVYEKGFYFLNEQVDIMRQQIATNTPAPCLEGVETLSNREIEVVQLICQQFTTSEIADKLSLNKRTIDGHRNNIFLKTGVKNIAGLVIYAIQNKIFEADLYDPSSFS